MVANSTFTKFRGFRGTPGTSPGSAPDRSRKYTSMHVSKLVMVSLAGCGCTARSYNDIM